MSTVYILSFMQPQQPPLVAVFHEIPTPHLAMMGLRWSLGANHEHLTALTLELTPYMQIMDRAAIAAHFAEQNKLGLHAGMSMILDEGKMLAIQRCQIL